MMWIRLVLAVALWSMGLPLCEQGIVDAERPASALRFYSIKGEPNVEKIEAALGELSAKLSYGPVTRSSKPGRAFVAVEFPADLQDKQVEKALRKGGGKLEALEWVAFEGREGDENALPNFGTGFAGRDHILGMSGEIRWFDAGEGWSQFYVVPGKLDAAELEKRYGELFDSYGGGTLGKVVEESFHWTLSVPVPEKKIPKLEKKILKLAGIRSARLTSDGTTLEVGASLQGLSRSGAPIPWPGAEGAVRARFARGPLYDLLAKEGYVPVQ